MNELALEIKKLAEKYRGTQNCNDNGYVNDQRYKGSEELVGENYLEDFDNKKLDRLEDEIANLNETNEDATENLQSEDSDDGEMEISDFINPGINIVEDSGYKLQNQDNQEVLQEDIEFDRSEKTAVNSNIRNIAKSLRDLKALLRENI